MVKACVLLVALALGLVSCAVPPLTLFPADTPQLHKSLRISDHDWKEILALVPAEERPAMYGAAHNYREEWVEVWIARPDAGTKPCGGHVLLFFQSKTGKWQQINEGLEWGDCPPDA